MNMKDTIDFYTLDGKIYLIVKEIEYNNHKYVYLTNEMDYHDLLLRRVEGNDLLPLTSEEAAGVLNKLFA